MYTLSIYSNAERTDVRYDLDSEGSTWKGASPGGGLGGLKPSPPRNYSEVLAKGKNQRKMKEKMKKIDKFSIVFISSYLKIF